MNKKRTNLTTAPPSFYLKILKGQNSKNIAFRVMPLHLATAPCHDEQVFQVCGVDTFDTFWVMGYIKVFVQRQRWWSSNDNGSTFSSKQMSL